MRRIRTSYIITVTVVWVLNGWALLYHLAYLPGFESLIAAALLTSMLAAPLVIWVAFIYGEIVEEEVLRRKHARVAKVRPS